MISVLFFLEIRRVKIRLFFQVTSVILILFAAGLVAHGIHELQEARLLPIMVEHLYDMNWIINEKGFLGEMLKSLFGYNGNPSLLEVVGYLGYMIFSLVFFLRIKKVKPDRKIDAGKDRAKSASVITEELAPSGRG